MENEAFNAAETKDIPGRFREKGEPNPAEPEPNK